MLLRAVTLMFGFWTLNLFAVVSVAPNEAPNLNLSKTNAKGTIMESSGEGEGDWFNESPTNSDTQGISVNKAYRDFGPGEKTIVVAVIDSGVDINHEDLQGKIWINEDEFPGNGIDDDGNGYIDDYAGWNFLGSAEGKASFRKVNNPNGFILVKGKPEYQVDNEALEVTREIAKLKKEARSLGSLPIEKQEYLKNLMGIYYNYLGSREPHYIDLEFEHPVRKLIEAEKKENGIWGNNDVIGPDSGHGTHVSGIIAAVRNNNIGVAGIASKVKIMAVRAVPNGDERDDDIAMAIRYAVDNGANIINMSFGKSVSPMKNLVSDAVMYAASKGVLLVHAAGNSAQENTYANNFPNTLVQEQSGGVKLVANNWIEVGASTSSTDKLAAFFSNYSSSIVDVFAPGYRVLSSTPDNGYHAFSGTSMASPVVAGAAAYLASHFPNKKLLEIKSALLTSSRKYEGISVKEPLKGPFKNLSRTGGIIDVHNAYKKLITTK